MRIALGQVGHFGLAVRDPVASAAWWQKHFDLDEIFRYEGGVGLSNKAATIAARPTRTPSGSRRRTRRPRRRDRTRGRRLVDMGLWFHDPDAYRWELSVQHAEMNS
ncbi:MAG: hypothetical protein WBX26_06790 [Candidatus Cybelea sp.]